MSEQLNMFDVIGLLGDPVYCLIDQLQENEEVKIGKHIVRKTDKYYEIENGAFHEGFASKLSCYEFLSGVLAGDKDKKKRLR